MSDITRWRGANMLEDARKEMEDVFRRFFGPEGSDVSDSKAVVWSPRVDVSETDKEIIVKADLPGVDPKAVEVTVHEGVLTVKGEKKEEREEKGKNFHRMERFAGSFFRTVPLPAGADVDKVNATTSNGTVTVTIPKRASAMPKKVELKPA